MILAVDCGHTLTGADYGASGYKEESLITREVGRIVIQLLRNAGHTVIDATVDNASTMSESLSRRVNKANSSNCDYYICIHFNAFNGTAFGTEVLYYSNPDERMQRVLNSICSSLGYFNRGLKQRTGLYVLKHTNMKAMLIECAFCDNRDDMNKYNPNKLAQAIVSGFLGQSVSAPTNPTKNEVKAQPTPNNNWLDDYLKTWNWNNWVRDLQMECNKQGFSNQTVDGIVGPATLNGCPTLKKGCKGNITKLLQEVLKAYGIANLVIDGDFGGATFNAVIAYQKSKGLAADGIVGRNTWSKLLGL